MINNSVLKFFWPVVGVVTALSAGLYGCTHASTDSNEQANHDVSAPALDAVTTTAAGETIATATGSQETGGLRSPGKPGAAVKLQNSRPIYIATPGMHELTLALVSPHAAGTMAVDVTVNEGAEIVSNNRHFEFTLQPDGEYHVPLTLNITEKGRFYVQLHTKISTEQQSSTRVIAAILQVGEPLSKLQTPADGKKGKKANTVIVLPAKETIIPIDKPL